MREKESYLGWLEGEEETDKVRLLIGGGKAFV